MKNALLIRVATLACLATLAGCGHSGGGPATVGVGVGVALTSPGGTAIITQGGSIEIDATVSGDSSNKGVTWTQSTTTAGAPTTVTTSKYVFQSTTGIVGAAYVTLTAIANADTTKTASVTLVINGSPVIVPPVLFPANQNVAYTTFLNGAGGTAPYTWTLASGTLPAGLTLSGGTSSVTAITGTPTAIGTSQFTIKFADSSTPSQSFQLQLSITVGAQTACLLSGPFAYLVTGYFAGQPVVRAGSVNVSGTGTVAGVYDIKYDSAGEFATALASSTCQTLTQNRGRLFLNSTNRSEIFDFATTSSLTAGHLQQDDATNLLEAGELYQQVPGDFNLAALAGDWVFGVVGDSGAGGRLAVIGRMTLDAGGAVSAAFGDSNGAGGVANGAITGTLTTPDASSGRGSAALSLGGHALPLAYYVVDHNLVLLVSNDAPGNTPRVAGRMTRQTGAGTLDATALSTPSILSLWGSSLVNGVPTAAMSVGRFSLANAGTIDLLLDTSLTGQGGVTYHYALAPYTVATSGRGTIAATANGVLRNFVLYADGSGGGYLIEPTSPTGNFGILEAQAPGPFSDFAAAYYVGGSLFPGSTSPITLMPQLLFQSGSVGGELSGNYALDPVTGRMLAAVSRTVLGGSDLVIYVVSANKLVVVGDSLNISNSQLAWFEHF